MSHRYELSSENKGAADQALDFPALRLKKGEVARLAIFSLITGDDGKKSLGIPQPEGGYFWGINKPDDGYGGSYECNASEETKAADEHDADACAHCRWVLEGVPEDVIQPRRRRFVMHVIRYRTQPGSAKVTQPFSVEDVAWRFTDRYFNALVDENEKWAAPDGTPGLLIHDITLTCENEGFQTFKVSVEPEAMWRKDKALMQLVVGTYAAGVELAPTLRRKLGSTISNEQIDSKIKEALRQWGLSEGGGPAAAPMQVSEDLIQDLGLADELFGSTPDAALTEEAIDAAVVDVAVDAAQAVVDAAPAEAAPGTVSIDEVEATVPAAAPAAEAAAGEIDFDEFFNQ